MVTWKVLDGQGVYVGFRLQLIIILPVLSRVVRLLVFTIKDFPRNDHHVGSGSVIKCAAGAQVYNTIEPYSNCQTMY